MSSNPSYFLERISKVQRQLSRLSEVLAREQEFNELHVRRMLEQPPPSSDSSNISTDENLVYREQEDDSTPAELGQLENSQSIYIEDSQQNITKSTQNREEEAAAFVLKLESELMASSMETEKAPYTNTPKCEQKKKRIDQKIQSNAGMVPASLQMTSGTINGHRVKSPKSTYKGSLKNISIKKSESYKELKKSMAASEVQFHHFERRKSGNKPMPFGKTIASSNPYDGRRLLMDNPYRPLDIRSPKLNKVNVNRLKETIKKTNGESKKSLEEKLHLNLNEGKTLMQRIIERRNFMREYQIETKKYENALKDIDERCLQEELNSSSLPMEAVDALVVFASQFSLKLTKRLISCEINNSQLHHKDVVKELWKLINSIPAKLLKHNVVSEERYNGLIKKCDELWSSLHAMGVLDRARKYKFVQMLQTVRSYVEFLFRNHLIETTERNNLYTRRRVMDYYSHRSDNQGFRKENVGSLPIEQNKRCIKKKKLANKGYETERRMNYQEPPVKPAPSELKKKNTNALKEHLQTQLKGFQFERNLQLSTRTGRHCHEDDQRKNTLAKQHVVFLRK